VDLRQQLANDYSDLPAYRTEMADTEVEIGHFLRLRQRPAEALPWYDRALAVLEPLHQESVPDVFVPRALRKLHWDRDRALDALNRPGEALADWDQAIELTPPADRPRMQLERARSQARAGEATAAVAEALALTKDPATPSALCCEAAGVYALASASAKEVSQWEAYAGQALALLRRAQADGFFNNRANIEHLKQEADLDPLRSREDFKKFVADLDAGEGSERGEGSEGEKVLILSGGR
jgi:tetratricopeptide (TPR) repeat protein